MSLCIIIINDLHAKKRFVGDGVHKKIFYINSAYAEGQSDSCADVRRAVTQSLYVLYNPEVNVRLLGKGLELLSANGGRFEIN